MSKSKTRKRDAPKPVKRRPRKRTTWLDREELRAALVQRGETVADLGRRCGVCREAARQWVSGRMTINETWAAKLGRWYDVPVFLQVHKEYENVQ